jgi:predicted 2-oxoglutarate/Fe(II)-dependent dioxygenase YbiX
MEIAMAPQSVDSHDSDSMLFEPKPRRTEWWEGDPGQLRLSPPDEQHRYLVRQRHVLSAAQCDCLIECFDRHESVSASRTGSAYWDGRYICHGSIPETERDALRIMQQARLLAQVTATQRFQPERPIYSDTAQIVVWTEGLELTPHADNLHPDGQPNATPHRCYSCLIYLNDDYEGGETYFPGFGLRVKPERGLLIIFGSGPECVHGVTRVRSGRRFTYAGWYTFDPAREDPSARVVF